ncbi:MAG: hypothetical protein DMF32_02865 [Verrucomicrobia bacterium]|nr:MAG: hypothetical protein DMF32_02865 [Verrucomicrobiota bacterium]
MFRQPLVVRTTFAVWFVVTAALCCVLRAQDQEKKLLDRLLKPDMTLQNDAQNKKFSGDGSVSINKRALKIILEHETSPPRRFILRPTAADVPPSRFRHSKHFQIPRLPGEVRLPMVFVTHLSPGKRSPLVRMPVTGPF